MVQSHRESGVTVTSCSIIVGTTWFSTKIEALPGTQSASKHVLRALAPVVAETPDPRFFMIVLIDVRKWDRK